MLAEAHELQPGGLRSGIHGLRIVSPVRIAGVHMQIDANHADSLRKERISSPDGSRLHRKQQRGNPEGFPRNEQSDYVWRQNDPRSRFPGNVVSIACPLRGVVIQRTVRAATCREEAGNPLLEYFQPVVSRKKRVFPLNSGRAALYRRLAFRLFNGGTR